MSLRGSSPVLPRRVGLFGTYARTYTVNRVLARALREAGFDVVECHSPLWEGERTKSAAYFRFVSACRLLCRYLGSARHLASRRKRLEPVDVYVLTFQGQLDVLLLGLLLGRRRRRIVFAPLVTLSETLIDDRQVFATNSFAGRLLRVLDRLSLRWPGRVVIDTRAHAEQLIRNFQLPRDRLKVWHLGCDTDVFKPDPVPAVQHRPLRVLFYGSFLPLHGIGTILAAAAILRDCPDVHFCLYGEGILLEECCGEADRQSLVNTTFSSWQDYESLGDLVSRHDICLGIFDDGQKAGAVIPNKVYQAAAVGRPVITADTPAVREVFSHGENIWLCTPANATALADAIRTLAADADLRAKIGGGAADLMRSRFSPQAQAERWASFIVEVCANV